jgi:prepilin-type N-terminal cleavage/methylation domain-containing protein
MQQQPTQNAKNDGGFTLIEVVATVMLLGLILVSVTAAFTVVVQQQVASSGRISNAVSEQSVGQWLTPDLASASGDTDISPGASACFTTCPAGVENGGSNVMLFQWTTRSGDGGGVITINTRVSYRYIQRGDGYDLVRVECVLEGTKPQVCSTVTVLRDVPKPPDDITFAAGVPVTWIAQVSDPLPPTMFDPTGAPALNNPKNARRVSINIDGGGGSGTQAAGNGGGGGGAEQITFTAGGTERRVIGVDSIVNAPTLVQPRSRCGGNFGVVVDTSASIGSTAMVQVRNGLTSLIDAFTGTPIKLQMVRFNQKSSSVGVGAGWAKYYDMSNPTDVANLKTGVNALVENGATNWEDGLYRLFYNADGSLQTSLPQTVLFFTDGVPTWSRFEITSAPSTAPAPRWSPDTYPSRSESLIANPTTQYYHMGYLRAAKIIGTFGTDVQFIGVGVGPGINTSTEWLLSNNTVSPRPAKDVLAAAIGNSKAPVLATTDVDGKYTNADVANLYISPTFDKFTDALRAIALDQCGGTVTVQTRRSGAPETHPFTYVNTAMRDSDGNVLTPTLKTVTTDADNPGATIDFTIPSGKSITVDIQPVVTSDLAGFKPAGWSCRSGPNAIAVTEFDVSGLWKGVRVSIDANAAISCVLAVVPA